MMSSNEVSSESATPLSSALGSHDHSMEVKYTWEHSLLLPATPDEVRNEVEILLTDLIVRLKQLLFNSLLCAYYVGFIPMQFADVSLIANYYNQKIFWYLELDVIGSCSHGNIGVHN